MKLLLTTLHAKYIHSSIALPYLAVSVRTVPNLVVSIREYSINDRTESILSKIISENADIVAFSCYIWNISETLKIVSDLKLVRPDIFIVLGGPEVSFGCNELLLSNPAVDFIVRGEGEETLFELISALTLHREDNNGLLSALSNIAGITFRCYEEVVNTAPRAVLQNLDSIPSPFVAGFVDDSKPLLYFETSRGCPFSCAFCTSSIEKGVRPFSTGRVENDLMLLMKRDGLTVKFVDRTFNYDAERANHIWEFILRYNRSAKFHFEIKAELLTDSNFKVLSMAPADMFRFEIGVQSTNSTALDSVGRESDFPRLFENISRLRNETEVTLHLDLVAGLPGEDIAGFLDSLEKLLNLSPHFIQIELLKVLKGTAMRKIGAENDYIFSAAPPYVVLKNRWLSFEDTVHIRKIAEIIEKFYNKGAFKATLKRISEIEPLSVVFDAMAKSVDISSTLLHEPFSFFVKFIKGRYEPEKGLLLMDALRFDYCMQGYPGSGFPDFLSDNSAISGSPKAPIPHAEIAERAGIFPSVRLSTFSAMFMMDYAKDFEEDSPVRLTFVYVLSVSRKAVNVISV
ncbi:MAG: B12-binding domain-containing radical SAM protein [Desulfuromonadales bacterium]|nr:B12-binding domain-containing radical SAM protein [Desulfuromonadales bacterium]